MNNLNPSTVLSDWYELVEGNELMQGDIFQGCPIFRPPAGLNWPVENNEALDFNVGKQAVVVMSQSCDLQAGQKTDMWLVMLCPVWKLSEAATVNQFLASSYGKDECRRGHLPGYHMIAECDHDQWKQEISIISFREV
jgi:hypothetical protein